ncbi:MAG: transposase [Gammaproteobacteria bacterium]|nr:transposase [Gammaproteobacteria bacterium]
MAETSRERTQFRRQAVKVKKSHRNSREAYGARRIVKDLVEDDEVISRTRVGRLMKQLGLKSKKAKG